MLGIIRQLNVFLIWTILFTMLPAARPNAIGYVIKLESTEDNSQTKIPDRILERFNSRSLSKTPDHILIQNLMRLLAPKLREKNRCLRLFGSIYGTKNQKQRCFDKFRKKKLIKPRELKDMSQILLNSQYDDLVYLDLILDSSPDIIHSTEYEAENVLPKYYVNPRTSQHSSKAYSLVNFRKSNPRVAIGKIHKRNVNFESSDDSETSDSQESDSRNDYRKPKRFQIIENEKLGKKRQAKQKKIVVMSDTDSNEESSSAELPVAKKRPLSKLKKKNVYKQDKVTQKEFYLQAGRLIDPDFSDDEFRRRLPIFLPKRYHWKEEDIHNLGYYWFNGPQGRYPYYALRP